VVGDQYVKYLQPVARCRDPGNGNHGSTTTAGTLQRAQVNDNGTAAMNFTFSKRARTSPWVDRIGLVVAAVVGMMGDHTEHHQYSWANLFVNGFFFFGIALGALFFFALQNATETGWTVLVKRVFEGIFSFPCPSVHSIRGDRGARSGFSMHVHHLALDGPHALP
jgi:hypothetical protein